MTSFSLLSPAEPLEPWQGEPGPSPEHPVVSRLEHYRPSDLPGGFSMKAKLSIGTWAYLFNQEKPTNDFHVILHKLQDLGYDGVELGSFGPHPSPGHRTRPRPAGRS